MQKHQLYANVLSRTYKNKKMSEQLTTSRPHEYLDLGGIEQQIPAIQQINEALLTGETFVVVGGGGSGKTESLVTAFENSDKSYSMFDLRSWTISRLSDETVRAGCLADPNLDELARAYITGLNETVLQAQDLPVETGAEILNGKIRDGYRYDRTYGIKYAEGYLLDQELARIYAGQVEFSTQNQKSDNSLRNALDAQSEILVLDEFDLGTGEDLAPVEIENARKLIQIAKMGADAQLGLVVHPPARNNPEFTQAVNTSLAERGTVREIQMSYFPKQVEQAALGTVGLQGELADRFMQDMQGLPTAYLDIATRPDLRAALMEESPDVRIGLLARKVEDKIAKNKRVIFDRQTPPTQEYLQGVIRGEEPGNAEAGAIQEAMINLYVTEAEGRVYMPPVVRRVLAKELDMDTVGQ